MVISISDLWHSSDAEEWNQALQRYWEFVQDKNVSLERKLEVLDLERLRNFDARAWYDFLKDEYFPWKYTDPRWLPTYLDRLRRYCDEDKLGELDQIRKRLLSLDHNDVRAGLNAARGAAGGISGLGVAGASGLLALIYPATFGTVDQFVVKALRQVGNLPERQAAALALMNPCALNIADGVVIIPILQRKAADNNRDFSVTTWTPRKLDKVLWTYGRKLKS
jgi:hypothetical protein